MTDSFDDAATALVARVRADCDGDVEAALLVLARLHLVAVRSLSPGFLRLDPPRRRD